MIDASYFPIPTGPEFARQLAASKPDVWHLVQQMDVDLPAALRD